MKLKTRTLKAINLVGNIYEKHFLWFVPLTKTYHPITSFYGTACKEEVGAQMVERRLNHLLIQLPKKLKYAQLQKVIRFIHKKEKQVNVQCCVFERIKYEPNWLLITHSPRWSRNSVVHSIFLTWLRLAINKELKLKIRNNPDVKHMKKARWVFEMIEKKGLRIFGTIHHKFYDGGVVDFMHDLCKIEDDYKYHAPPLNNIQKELGWVSTTYLPTYNEVIGGEQTINFKKLNKHHAYKRLMKLYFEEFMFLGKIK